MYVCSHLPEITGTFQLQKIKFIDYENQNTHDLISNNLGYLISIEFLSNNNQNAEMDIYNEIMKVPQLQYLRVKYEKFEAIPSYLLQRQEKAKKNQKVSIETYLLKFHSN